MNRVNFGLFIPDSSMTLANFVERSYLPWTEAEQRPSTSKGYREIWENHFQQHVGHLRLREFRSTELAVRARQDAKQRKSRK